MKINYQKIKRNTFRILLLGFAMAGFVFFIVYLGMQFNWFNVKGSVSERNSYFNLDKKSLSKGNNSNNLEIVCKINVLSKFAPLTSINIYKTLTKGASDELLNKMLETASRRFTNDYSYKQEIDNCKNFTLYSQELNIPISAYNWADTDQWNLMKEVFTRDQDIIKRAAKDAQISPRLILGGIIGEQFRFFNNRRESFKTYFEPLKILASLSNTSFGIAGLKPKTVGIIEDNLKNKNSVFYLGPNLEHIVDYNANTDIEIERMNRITNAKDPYYSYLYVGLYMKEIIAQWQKAGYDISSRPEILATLYNLGFYYSVPKENPEVGGSIININSVDYTFGDIAYEFYYSGELSDIFPIEVQ
ncbi:MAG: hypothetical protein WCT42_01840 [Candidatus Paceibacterota bacterium]